MRTSSHALATLLPLLLPAALAAQPFAPDAIRRGGDAVRGKPPMNPATFAATSYRNLWKQWGLKEKPADFDAQLRERYGLHPAPYDNGGLPMGLHYSRGLLGQGIANDCLLCHAGVVAGQTIVGLANASLDLQGLLGDLAAEDRLPVRFPFAFSPGRGLVDPANPVAFLMEFREPDLRLRPRVAMRYTRNVGSDPPAWWLLKRKKTRNWSGGVRVDSLRVDMVNLLTPLNSAEHIKKHEPTFADIHAFVMSVEAPKYPFPVDAARAAAGRGLFNEHCARCHGTYGPDGTYPSKVVPLDVLGTDPTLAEAVPASNLAYFNRSWFGQERAPDGSRYVVKDTHAYQAPPLDGVWATAPYFHNGSVPTLEHVLNSKARPRIFTRSYGTAREDYDAQRVGWKVTVLDDAPGPDTPAHERRKVCDTTAPGRSNAGHTFGDRLTADERRAVIEYLKTL